MSIQTLNFYDSLAKKLSARHTACGTYNIPSIIVDRNHLTPFCLSRIRSALTLIEEQGQWPITEVNLVNSKGVSVNIVSKFRFKIAKTANTGTTMKELILYAGDSVDLALTQDMFYLHIKDAYSHQGYNANNWYSDDFRFSHITNKIKFKYTCDIPGNKYLTDNDLWFYPSEINGGKFYYELEVPTTTKMTPDFDSYIETTKNQDQFDQYGFQRFADIRTTIIQGDTQIKKTLAFIAMLSRMNEGDVRLIDEVGNDNQIIIIDIPIDPFVGNYASIEVKYRIKGDEIRSNNRGVADLTFIQEITYPPELEPITPALLRSHGKVIQSGDHVIQRH